MIKSVTNKKRRMLPRDPFARYENRIDTILIAKVIFRYIRRNTSLPVLTNVHITEDFVKLVDRLEDEAFRARDARVSAELSQETLSTVAKESDFEQTQHPPESGGRTTSALDRAARNLQEKYGERLVRFDEKLVAEIHDSIQLEESAQVLEEIEREPFPESPKSAQEYYCRGSHYCAEGKHKQAIEDFQSAEKVGPIEGRFLRALAGCQFYHMHDPESALRIIERACETDRLKWSNDFMWSRQLNAEILFSLGRTEEALEIVKTDLEHLKQLISEASWDKSGEGKIGDKIYVSGPAILMSLQEYKHLCEQLKNSPIPNKRAIKKTNGMKREIGKMVRLF